MGDSAGILEREGVVPGEIPVPASDAGFVLHLWQSGAVPQRELGRVSHLQADSGESLAVLLTRLGLISEPDLARQYSDYFRIPLIGPGPLIDSPLEAADLSISFLRHACVIPFCLDGVPALAMRDPQDDYPLKAMEFFTGQPLLRAVASGRDIETALGRRYAEPLHDELSPLADPSLAEDDIDRLRDLASEAPVIRLVQRLVTDAIERKASDIHVEPLEDRLSVRYRIDGVLEEVESLPATLRSAVVSRIKIMSHLDIAERRLPQDGRTSLTVHGRETDFRVATSPTMHGESVVLRILDRRELALDFQSLGYRDEDRAQLTRALHQPHGIILVTGPTGSGKTTTLYAALNELNTPGRKILTAEDPIEYTLERVNQTQIRPQIGHDFANALRSFLRQDPDIIMVGEVRDVETARIAIQASLTGHLLLSTLHTNSAAAAVARLLDMGVEEYLLASTLTLVIGQRLVRRLCTECRKAYDIPGMLRRDVEQLPLDASAAHFYRAVGCSHCKGTGYGGRLSIAELLPVDDAIQGLILERAPAGQIERQAVAAGMRTMKADGLIKALSGLTSVEEVLRVTQSL